MHDAERVIGKLEEFQDWSKKEFEFIRKNFEVMQKDIQLLNHFKWQVYGGAVVVSGIIVILSEILKGILRLHA